MTLDARLAIAFVVLMAVFPYALLRGRARNVYAAVDAASYALLAAAGFLAPLLGAAVDGSLAFALLLVVKLALFAIVLMSSAEGIGANGAAAFAGAIYLLLVPHVLQWPIDGDEPFYLLVTESIVRDGDFDLRNQYERIEESSVRRPDLKPQWGDPVGARGEQYSRHEPFLSFLLIPGYLLAGLPGAVATIALFGALFVRSFLLLLEEEGVSARTRAILFPLVAFAPPVVHYSTRIWPEVLAASFLTEALRAARSGRRGWLVAMLAALSLLKLRFLPIAATILALDFLRRRDRRTTLLAGALLAVPLIVAALVSGSAFNVHAMEELMPGHPLKYLRGAFGILLDAQAGFLFQAPLWFAALFALARWRELPPSFRLGALAAVPYLVLLFPRDEWHGGWSPPLRYLVVFAPVFVLGAAWVVERVDRFILAAIGVTTAVLAAHGIAFPWRLFHIASGESVAGEWLSARSGSDVSRLFPSFIRTNRAAIAATVLLLLLVAAAVAARRFIRVRPASHHLAALLAIMVAMGAYAGQRPGSRVDFEDAHVTHDGGTLDPHIWTVARFRFRGGWTLREGDAVSFQFREGTSRLQYRAAGGATILIDGREIRLGATGEQWGEARVAIPARERIRLQCVAGEVTLDRMVHER